jgi:ketosteroid isomerase-like protein
MTESLEPLEVAMDFIKRINAGNVDALCELMTEGHIFQDALGKRFMGRETMRQGWKAYFKMVADYNVRAEEFFQTKNRLAIFGVASGTCCGSGGAKSLEKFWQVPAAWGAVVDGGLIAEWRVYADNQPLRKLMGDATP